LPSKKSSNSDKELEDDDNGEGEGKKWGDIASEENKERDE